MKAKLFLALAALALTATTADARSWRVNNDVRKKANFTDINAAMSSTDVQDGDTLYLDPACGLTTTQNVTKGVTIIGCGYNGALVPYGFATISGTVYMKAAYSKLLGVNVTGAVYIAANYVTIERCRCTGQIRCTGDNYQYAHILDCYISSGEYNIAGDGKTSTKSSFWVIENNIIQGSCGYYGNIFRLYNATIRNNLIVNTYTSNSTEYGYCLKEIGNSRIINNIIMQTARTDRNLYSVDTGELNNNVLSGNYRPEFNRCNVTKTDSIFTGDYQSYVLKDDSPARGYGMDGNDCGIFGGLYPYVKGGIPYGHPYYENYVISSHPVDGKVNVSLKIKMQDE